MNNVFTAKLLQNLQNKKGNKGFTLIELLVVVIIVGVLAAVALPNLLGQVGKARETEGKNGVGSINRALQSFHFEARDFPVDATTASDPALEEADFQNINNALSLALVSEFYDYQVGAPNNTDPGPNPTDGDDTSGAVAATANNASQFGIREYAGQVGFDASDGNYAMGVCQEFGVASGNSPAINTLDFTDPSATTCTNGILLR